MDNQKFSYGVKRLKMSLLECHIPECTTHIVNDSISFLLTLNMQWQFKNILLVRHMFYNVLLNEKNKNNRNCDLKNISIKKII